MAKKDPNDASVRYDRQVRLWGSGTQRGLQVSTLLMGPQAVGSEAAKNLVLGGIGRVALFDPRPVSDADVASSCLFRPSDVIERRASDEAAAERLRQLNPLVQLSVAPSLHDLLHHHRRRSDAESEGLVILIVQGQTLAQLRDIARDFFDVPPRSVTGGGTSDVSVPSAHPSRVLMHIHAPASRAAFIAVLRSAADVDDRLLSPRFLERRDPTTQRTVLQWALCREGQQPTHETSFAARIADALDTRDALGVDAGVSDSVLHGMVVEAAHDAEAAPGHHPVVLDATLNSIVGGVLCQQVIGRVSRFIAASESSSSPSSATSAAAGGTIFDWAMSSPHEVIVGEWGF